MWLGHNGNVLYFNVIYMLSNANFVLMLHQNNLKLADHCDYHKVENILLPLINSNEIT